MVLFRDSRKHRLGIGGVSSVLKRCGGSSLSDTLVRTGGTRARRSYFLVGRCDFGPGEDSEGWSAARGWELATPESMGEYDHYSVSLDVGTTINRSVSVQLGAEYEWSAALTPTLDAISRLNGSSAGGTSLTLNGTQLGPNATISIAGRVVCATDSCRDS